MALARPVVIYTRRDTSLHDLMLDVVLDRYGFFTIGDEWFELTTWDHVPEVDAFRWEARPAHMAGAA